jgi:hypothetical protein
MDLHHPQIRQALESVRRLDDVQRQAFYDYFIQISLPTIEEKLNELSYIITRNETIDETNTNFLLYKVIVSIIIHAKEGRILPRIEIKFSKLSLILLMIEYIRSRFRQPIQQEGKRRSRHKNKKRRTRKI